MNILIAINGYSLWKILVDAYLIWIIVLFVAKLVISNKKILNLVLIFIVLLGVNYLAKLFELKASTPILQYIIEFYPIILVIIMAPNIRRSLEILWKQDTKSSSIIMGSQSTRDHIVEAAMELSSQKIGAIITIEKHNTLDQFADRAIMMHSDISKELLINIFTPNTPLHDGAVIIRGDKILCAGAYYILSEEDVGDKTMGSRHRASMGISEITDSLTVIVSEETGKVSIAVEGIILPINDRDKLMEYISMFMS